MNGVRVGVYYAPAPSDPLWAAGAAWLGRDAELAAAVAQPNLDGIGEFTADPRGYGFHATLKPPMRLATSFQGFMADVERLARRLKPFTLPGLHVTELTGFLALTQRYPSPDLQNLADMCVADLDRHRAPPDEAELERRRRAQLSPLQDSMLVQWGYPYVFDTWFFHMTLTRRLSESEAVRLQPLAERHFAPSLARVRRVDSLAVFTQAGPGAPFLVAERVPFG